MWIILAYGCGSVPFALLIGLARGVDIRNHGSGNVGATNCGRTLGRRFGIACFVLDVFKGFAPVAAAGAVNGWFGQNQLDLADAWWWLAVAAAAVVGHVFPIWLKFRGGKGVATGLGVLLGFWPILTVPGLIALGVWLLVAMVFRMVSLASVVAAMSLPLALVGATWFGEQTLASHSPFLIVTVFLATIIVVRHRTNLSRLLTGKEEKIGQPGNPD